MISWDFIAKRGWGWVCDKCGNRVKVNKNGAIRKHCLPRPPYGPRTFVAYCPFSGRKAFPNKSLDSDGNKTPQVS